MEAEGLETGYADRGRRFVRFLHPAVDIIAIQEKKKDNNSFLWHFSEVGKWGRRKSNIIKLLDLSLGLSHWLSLKSPSLSGVRVAATERHCASATLPAALIAAL